ncbi:MAG TPA: MFS transporter [Pseudonocardiaceae bacterium]|jgi:EmrB/QacA subfamily drug resistance transporter|nr:MFS transporter [Pseudonocardiaceae bacterium]
MGTPAGRWVLLATISGSGMAMLDATVVNIALPSIGRDFGADFRTLQWIVNAYTLTLAALILLAGALGDRFGRRRVFVVGVVWFAVASLLCGLAPTAQVLVAARAAQGIGGALLTPGSLAIISSSFAATDRARAVGAWSGLGGVAAAIGPFAGGYLVTLNWRAVFLVNLPIAVFTVVVALRHVPESLDTQSPPGLDVTGAALTAVGLAGVTYALTSLGAGDGGKVALFVAGAGGLAALLTFVLVERRSPHPLVPLSLFANRRFSVTNAVTLLVYAALGVFFFLLVLQLQIVAGFSPLVAGTALLPVTVLMLLLSARAGALAERIGPRLPMNVGPLLAAIGLLLTLRIGRGASYLADVLPAVLVLGLGLSLTVAPLTATVLSSASPRYAGTASGVNNAIARAGGLLAVAVIPAAAGLGGADYTDPLSFEAGFHTAMVISAGLLALSSVLAAVLLRDPHETPTAAGRIRVERCPHCAVAGPQLHPAQRGS